MSDAADSGGFQYTIQLDSGHVLFDCGYVAPIAFMWDADGELTLDGREAVCLTFRHPSDTRGRDHAFVDLRTLTPYDTRGLH